MLLVVPESERESRSFYSRNFVSKIEVDKRMKDDILILLFVSCQATVSTMFFYINQLTHRLTNSEVSDSKIRNGKSTLDFTNKDVQIQHFFKKNTAQILRLFTSIHHGWIPNPNGRF